MSGHEDGLAWQTGVWDAMSNIYLTEIEPRFAPVVAGCLRRAALRPGESVLDLGSGSGAVAVQAATAVGTDGSVLAVDLSPEMLELATQRAESSGLSNVMFRAGRAEVIPAGDGAFDAVIASLSLMYALDRGTAARECARVLRQGGRFVAAVWAGPDDADIVRFQQIVGSFAPPPPAAGVGPGVLANTTEFVGQLRDAGIRVAVTTEVVEFAFDEFEQAWDVLAGVTAGGMDAARRADAKHAVRDAMWPDPAAPQVMRNVTQFLSGTRD